HASDAMLRRMSRRVTRSETEALLARLRSRIEGLTLRTTFITGFPGETDADFHELVQFVEKHRFERMGVFTYSFEPDTPAAKLPDHVPADVMEALRQRLMQLPQQIAFSHNEQKISPPLDVVL